MSDDPSTQQFIKSKEDYPFSDIKEQQQKQINRLADKNSLSKDPQYNSIGTFGF
jgi:hypothetical protein